MSRWATTRRGPSSPAEATGSAARSAGWLPRMTRAYECERMFALVVGRSGVAQWHFATRWVAVSRRTPAESVMASFSVIVAFLAHFGIVTVARIAVPADAKSTSLRA